jgi:Tfp pilus assembly pilus retraction ATPase PilT
VEPHGQADLSQAVAFGIERGVSDIHFEVGYPPHYRLHGELLGAIKVAPMTAPTPSRSRA